MGSEQPGRSKDKLLGRNVPDLRPGPGFDGGRLPDLRALSDGAAKPWVVRSYLPGYARCIVRPR